MGDFKPADLVVAATELLARCRLAGQMLATAESCTGGLIAATLTEIAGSSDVVDRGFVTYSNAAKTDLLEVPATLIDRVGAVSPEVAAAMAEGAIRRSRAGVSIAVTGIAGPGGGTATKPVGLVFIAAGGRAIDTLVERHEFGDIGRAAVRWHTVAAALRLAGRQLRRQLPPG